MSLSRTAILLGLLVLNACSVGTVTASSAREPSALIATPNWGRDANSTAASDRVVAPVQVERTTTHDASVVRFHH